MPCCSAQADRRALNITLNSIGTELTRDDRKKLYSNFGLLYPHGQNELSAAEDFDQVRAAMEKVPSYANIFNKVRAGTCNDGCRGLLLGLCRVTCVPWGGLSMQACMRRLWVPCAAWLILCF